MQAFRQNFQPIAKQYNRFLNGFYLSDLLSFKGGQSIGSDYLSKVSDSQHHQIQQKYTTAVSSVKNPTLQGFFFDNWPRLFLLNAFERLIVAYQAYPSMKQRFTFPGTFSHTFTQIMNQGAFKGTLKGLSISLLQFSFVLYPAMYFTNKSKSDTSKFYKFIAAYTVLDTLLYPLDSIKNIMYANTLGGLGIRSILNSVQFSNLYRGYFTKMIYNLPLLSGYYCTTQTGKETEAILSWIAAAIFYPLNTAKVVSQISGSPLTRNDNLVPLLSQSYRGVIPFILINSLIGWNLRGLFSESKLQEIHHEVNAQKLQKLGFI